MKVRVKDISKMERAQRLFSATLPSFADRWQQSDGMFNSKNIRPTGCVIART